MEKSNRELESQVNAQQKQLARYEHRLKDVITAYKSLLKEKEALDATVASFATTNNSTTAVASSSKSDEKKTHTDDDNNTLSSNSTNTPTKNHTNTSNQKKNDDFELKQQLATLMNSLATLSAEKSRMEASFQADKRQLRQELQQKDKEIKELNERGREEKLKSSLEVEKIKSKLILERHSREQEQNDHMVMVHELQKLLSDERHLKENLEMQLTDLKNQFSHNDNTDGRVKELLIELDTMKKKFKEMKNIAKISVQPQQIDNSAAILKQLQAEMASMKQQHIIAITNEQRRAILAEERNKNLAAIHEDRVANLESRLAELSTTVGTYDRLRQSDQDSILKLKEKIAVLESSGSGGGGGGGGGDDGGVINSSTFSTTIKQNTELTTKNWDISTLIDEITHLKKLLLIENAKQSTPQDLTKLFSFSSSNDQHHSDCIERYEKLRNDYEKYKTDTVNLHQTIETQKNHMKTLQDKIQVLNRNIDEQEQELKTKSVEHFSELKGERSKWKEMIASMEVEFRGKIAELEHQLQKQRERSLTLLEEKENEIKTLKTSFDLFLPSGNNKIMVNSTNSSNITSDVASSSFTDQQIENNISNIDQQQTSNNEEMKRQRKISPNINNILAIASNQNLNQSGGGGGGGNSNSNGEYHMLHYVHELSRKEVEITGLRKAKNQADASLRQALQDKVASQQELHDCIGMLEEKVDRLERNKSRESANLEYLKNVVLSFLVENDADSKRHMVNAIGAVLQFNPNEMKSINNYFIGRSK